MVTNIGWLITGILLIPGAVFVTVLIGRRVLDPEGLVSAVDKAAAQGRGAQDPDFRRAALRWPGLVVPAFWFVTLYTWPRTIDFLIRGEWNVISAGQMSGWANTTSNYLIYGVVICAVLGLTITFWNQPKLLVHPYFRGDPGMLKARRLRAEGVDVDALYEASAERWRERRARRRGRGGAPG